MTKYCRTMIFALFLVMVSSCVGSLRIASTVDMNIYHLSQICIGMTDRDVLNIMHQPYDLKVFDDGEDHYEIWLYVTCSPGLGQTRMVVTNLTPLTFKNGIFIASGYRYYSYFMEKRRVACRARINAAKPQPKPTAPPENQELEKAIQKAAKP